MKDYASRHPDWIGAERPPYETHDSEFDRKLADAIEWLRCKQQWRGEAGFRHIYVNAQGQITDPDDRPPYWDKLGDPVISVFNSND